MSEFDKGIKPGDLITAYHAGFHVVVKVERRFVTKADEERYDGRHGKAGDEYNSLVYYKTVMSAKYKPSKSKKEKCCDAAFCFKLSKAQIEKRRAELLKEINEGHDALLRLANH